LTQTTGSLAVISIGFLHEDVFQIHIKIHANCISITICYLFFGFFLETVPGCTRHRLPVHRVGRHLRHFIRRWTR